MLDVSLVWGPAPVVLGLLGVLTAVFLLARQDRGWWLRTVPAVVVGSTVLVGGVALLINGVWRPLPDRIPTVVFVWLGVAVAGLGLVALRVRRSSWGTRALLVPAALLVVLTAAQGVNLYYREFPTLRTALGLSYPNQVSLPTVPAQANNLVSRGASAPLSAGWLPPPGMPAHGVVAEVAIPSPASRFPARSGWLYLPPAYLSAPRAQLPVLVLVAGQPGSPRDWLNGGQLAQRMDAFAAGHEGLAPVVVMPDDLGQTLANPLCLDSRLGNVATYLTVDVPAWIRQNLQVDPDPRSWAFGGLSQGGTCALQMAVTAPQVYPTFLDLSGQREPTLGNRQQTVQAAFGGDEAAFQAVNPLDLLAARSYPDVAGMLVVGADDTTYLSEASQVLAACQGAGMRMQFQVLPGGHTWPVWGTGLSASLPWLSARLGLTG